MLKKQGLLLAADSKPQKPQKVTMKRPASHQKEPAHVPKAARPALKKPASACKGSKAKSPEPDGDIDGERLSCDEEGEEGEEGLDEGIATPSKLEPSPDEAPERFIPEAMRMEEEVSDFPLGLMEMASSSF
eukprot:7445694-Alexandrium_andersonii.AAC.1